MTYYTRAETISYGSRDVFYAIKPSCHYYANSVMVMMVNVLQETLNAPYHALLRFDKVIL